MLYPNPSGDVDSTTVPQQPTLYVIGHFVIQPTKLPHFAKLEKFTNLKMKVSN